MADHDVETWLKSNLQSKVPSLPMKMLIKYKFVAKLLQENRVLDCRDGLL